LVQKVFGLFALLKQQFFDWIGLLIPVPKAEIGQDIIIWKDEPLTEAVVEGQCGVIDGIESAPAKMSERLNALLDPKEFHDNMIFCIPEKNCTIKSENS
jgi:hypothetical protein